MKVLTDRAEARHRMLVVKILAAVPEDGWNESGSNRGKPLQQAPH
jgi:hypothetical protein